LAIVSVSIYSFSFFEGKKKPVGISYRHPSLRDYSCLFSEFICKSIPSFA